MTSLIFREQSCSQCGCTDDDACVLDEDAEVVELCAWYSDTLCTFCASGLNGPDYMPRHGGWAS